MYYTVRRDDSELRVVTCPKCKGADITRHQKVIPYKLNGYLLRLMQCNSCQAYFTFYTEDGMKEITQEMAKEGLKKGRGDMLPNGEDCHGHSFYILFKNEPPSITQDEYNSLNGWETDGQGNYVEGDERFRRWLDALPPINYLIRNRKLISAIDFDNMSYLCEEKIEWFK